MAIHRPLTAIAATLLILSAACTGKDQEQVRRNEDGSKTFTYVPPPAQLPDKAASAPPAPDSSKQVPINPKANARSGKFVYRPDPRLLDQLQRPGDK